MDEFIGGRQYSHTWIPSFTLTPIGREQIVVVKTTENMAEAVLPHPRQTKGGLDHTYGVRGLTL